MRRTNWRGRKTRSGEDEGDDDGEAALRRSAKAMEMAMVSVLQYDADPSPMTPR